MNDNMHLLQRKIGNVVFPHPLMIAGGVYKTAENIRRVATSDVIPEWGSFTTKGGSGNGGRDYYAHYHTLPDGSRILLLSQNSLGLPNPDMTHAEEYGPELIKLYADHGKPLTINVSGTSISDLVTLIKRAITTGFRVITANGSCPNKIDAEGKPGPMICWDPDSIDEFFERIEREIGPTDCVILWKVSIGMPRALLERNGLCVATSTVVTGIITGNTIAGTVMYLPDGKTTIHTTNGITRGGMSGPVVQSFALDDVEYCVERMPPHKLVVGCGGVGSALHLRRFIRARATLVQMNTAFREANENPSFVTNILEDYVAGV